MGMRLARRSTGSDVPMWSNAGSLAAFAWLAERGQPRPTTRWFVQIALDVVDQPAQRRFDERADTRFHLDIYSEEWAFFFCHAGRASWIRITDIAFAHGRRDDYALLPRTPELARIGELVRALEAEHELSFRREHAHVRTDLGEPALLAIRNWVVTL